MKFCGSDLPPQEVTFFRYFFSTLTILPVLLYHGKKSFQTTRFFLHVIRSGILFIAISCWIKGLTMSSLLVGGIFAQTTQFFVVIMAFLFLKEVVRWQKSLSVFIGFLGVLIVSIGESNLDSLFNSFYTMNNSVFFFLVSSLLFALSDIINKYIVCEEPMLSMIFYIALGTVIFSIYPAVIYWKIPSFQNLLYLVVLGAGSNALLFFLLQSFKATDISNLVSIRYIEIISAGILGYFFFSEIPSYQTFFGAFLIMMSATIMSFYNKISLPKK